MGATKLHRKPGENSRFLSLVVVERVLIDFSNSVLDFFGPRSRQTPELIQTLFVTLGAKAQMTPATGPENPKIGAHGNRSLERGWQKGWQRVGEKLAKCWHRVDKGLTKG